MVWTDKGYDPVYDICVVIGRFQPFHMGHAHLIREAVALAKHVIVLIGSTSRPRDPHNPFTGDERAKMIAGEFPHVETAQLIDYTYDDPQWEMQVQNKVAAFASALGLSTPKVCLVGHDRDDTTYYLNSFPAWSVKRVEAFAGNISGSKIRKRWLESGFSSLKGVSQPVHNIIRALESTPEIKELVPHYKFLKSYQSGLIALDKKRILAEILEANPGMALPENFKMPEKFSSEAVGYKYPPTFNTGDAVVVCHGYVLMVKRRAFPGKGLWALPGGFIKNTEWLIDTVLRELDEETKISKSVSMQELRSSIRYCRTFDSPHRSLRGRTITFAGLIVLSNPKLPKVSGADDAAEAFWLPVSEIDENRDRIFEDHADVIHHMLGRF